MQSETAKHKVASWPAKNVPVNNTLPNSAKSAPIPLIK